MVKTKKGNQKENSLIKIDSGLYEEVIALSNADPINYPSIKNFVEKAIRDYIGSIKYNIENKQELITPEGILKSEGKNVYVQCLVCDKLFLNDRIKNKQGKNICPKCAMVVKVLNEKL